MLFSGLYGSSNGTWSFDVTSDGRFLMVKRGDDPPPDDHMTVTVQWLQELARRVANDR